MLFEALAASCLADGFTWRYLLAHVWRTRWIAFRIAAGAPSSSLIVRSQYTMTGAMPHCNLSQPVADYGMDIGKNIFHVVGLSCDRYPTRKCAFELDSFAVLGRLDPTSSAWKPVGAPWLAPKIQPLGHNR